jgi:hypothetical protein
MKKWDEYVGEATKSKYEVYHETYTDATREAIDYAEANGYTVDEDERFKAIGLGPRKPSKGETVDVILPLYKDGKLQRKTLHIQVYNRETNRKTYELTCYVS